jgi:uncharacterized protein YndB with AHSA1/START domain
VTDAETKTRTVVVERDMPHPPERVWRALTQPHLIEEWLMRSNFEATVGHKFSLRAGWGSIDCEVLEVEPQKTLSYAWEARGLRSTVTWTLSPTEAGTRLRMEHAGFSPDMRQAYMGATAGWRRYFDILEQLLAKA